MSKLANKMIPKEMPHVGFSGTLEERCNWEAVAREHVQKLRHVVRKAGKLGKIYLSEDMIKRRMRAAVGLTDQIIEKYREVPGCEPEYKDETGYDWLNLNLVQLKTLNHIDSWAYLLFAASIWILDEILLPDIPEKRRRLFQMLPRDDHDIDDLFSAPDCWHACYDYDLILSVMYVLYYRNRDIAPVEMDDDQTERRIISSLEAKGMQHQEVPSRIAFDALMELIPEESVQNAVRYFEDLFRQWTDRYFDCLSVLNIRTHEMQNKANRHVDQYNRIRQELKDAVLSVEKERENRKKQPKKPAYNPLLVKPIIDEFMFEQHPVGNGIRNIGFRQEPFPDRSPDKVLELADRLNEASDRALDDIDHYEECQRLKMSFALDMAALGYINPAQCSQDYGPEVMEKMKPLKILRPFEAAFALLWLIDSGSDLPWVSGCACGLMREVADSFPWGNVEYKEYRDPVWESDEEEYAENIRLSTAKPSGIPEWYERNLEPKGDELSLSRSMAQILYEETGCIMPRDIHKYDGRQKKIRDSGLPAKDMKSMLLLCTALSHARRSERALNFDEDILQIWDKWDREDAGNEESGQEKTDEAEKPEDLPPTEEELTERIRLLQTEIKKLRISLHDAEKTSREARQELLSVRSHAELDRRELADLRELVFNLDHEAGKEETAETADAAQFPYEVQKETVVFGGHDSWLKVIRPMLTGRIRFVDRDLVFDVNVVRNADVIWIQPNAISHSQFYRIADVARQYDKPVRYFTNASAAKSAVQLMKADQ